MVHVPGTLILVHYLGFAGAGWAVVLMRTAHLSFTICECSLLLPFQQPPVELGRSMAEEMQ